MLRDFFRVVPKKRVVKITRKKGLIYHNPGKVGHFLFYIANMSFVLAMAYLVYLYYPLGHALFVYETSKTNWPIIQEQIISTEEVVENPKAGGYTITVPKILASSKVIEEVSPFNSQEYLKILKEDYVAQAKGTDLPGQGVGSLVYIFAHSTQQGLGIVRNNSVFYLLGQLKKGDRVYLDRNGERYNYQVYQQKIVNANQVEFLDYSDPEREVLILQTCWPIGTDWKRLLVFAERQDI